MVFRYKDSIRQASPIALLAAVLFLPACQSPGTQQVKTPTAQVSYAGDAACASCHEDEYTSFQTHGMANSFHEMTVDGVIENFSAPAVYHGPTDYFYRAYREGDQFFQEETRVKEGETIHRLVREITHVVGSAQAARTYLSESNGRFYELPLTWYSQKGVWDLSPGYSTSNARFGRKLTARCVACHSDAPPVSGIGDDVFERAPLSISCERCHGSGAQHVSARQAVPDPPTEEDPTIINPARLELDRRLDVCQQCHLNGAVVMYPDGKSPYSFQPGDRLSDHQIMFAPSHDSEIDVISHADRLKLSACFLESVDSLAPMDCTTCHDPHTGFRESGPSYFNQTCATCHASIQDTAPDHTAQSNCISCHMAKTEVSNAPHSTFTDHFIRASVPEVVQTVADSEPLVLESLYGDAADDDLAMAYLTYGWVHGDFTVLQRGITLADRAKEELLAPGNSAGALLWGKSLVLAGSPELAEEPLRVALEADTTDAERLHTIGKAMQAMGDSEEAEVFFRKALELEPKSVPILADLGHLLQVAERSSEAEGYYRLAVEEEPWSVLARNGLSAVLAELGRVDEAIVEAEEAIKLDPDHIDALTNLGTLLARSGNMDRARRALGRAAALGIAQGNMTPAFNMGLLSMEVEDYDEAVRFFGQVVRLNANNPTARIFLARAFIGQEKIPSALAQVNAALNVAPDNEAALALKAQLEAGN